jgi:molecular chaperone DnaK
MYLGIDLGTSNSAIVGNDGTELRLFKTSDGYDVLASAIMIDRRGAMFVGQRAYDQDAFSPESVAKRFKRLMGTNSPITFKGADRTMTPEGASSEILKVLLAQAKMAVGDLTVEGAIITIPAAFNQMQSEATMCWARCGDQAVRSTSRADCCSNGIDCGSTEKELIPEGWTIPRLRSGWWHV